MRCVGNDSVKSLFEEHQRGLANGHALWMATMLELWHERHVEGNAPDITPTRTMRGARPPVVVESPAATAAA